MDPKLSVVPVLRQESQARILRFLWESRSEWSGREIARRTGMSAPSTHAALKRLFARGLVHFRRVSNLHLYRINEGSYIVRGILAPLFNAEKHLPDKMFELARRTLTSGGSGAGVLSIVLFGSLARGQGKLESDLDLLIVLASEAGRKAVETRVEALRGLLAQRFSVPLSPYVQTLAEARHKYAGGLPLMLRIVKEGKRLYGKELKELLE